METNPSKNIESQRREEKGIVYYNRGRIEGENGISYDRFAIQTHFVHRGESQFDLVEKYFMPLYEPGDVLSFGAKVMAMCVESVRTRDEVKPGFWANILWRFASSNETGIGMHEPGKMQLVIDMVGLPRVLWAAILSGVTKPFGKRGVFYEVCGEGIGGIDGFYDRSSFEVYKDLALINPPNPDQLSDELAAHFNIPVVLMDANDIQRDQLGKSSNMVLTDEQIQEAMVDNPSGQDDELTPLILIRPIKK